MTSIKIKLSKSANPDKEGTLQLQIIRWRKVKLISTKLKVYPYEWDQYLKQAVSVNNKRQIYLAEVNRRLDALVTIMEETIEQLWVWDESYTVDDVYALFIKKAGNERMFFYFMGILLQKFKNLGNMSAYNKHSITLKLFSQCRLGKDVAIEKLRSHDIIEFEKFLFKRKIVPNTVSFYMRILRSVYNKAVTEGLSKQNYPFSNVYTGIAKTRKRAISQELLINMQKLDLEKGHDFARDLFMFSFYARGISFIDMAHLKKDNCKNGCIKYVRSKTGTLMQIKIEPCMQIIMNKYSSSDNQYVFPIIKTNYAAALRLYNLRLKKLSVMLGTEIQLTSYVSRHTWASQAKKKGISLRIISEGMGHSTENTTRIYLDSLDNNIIDEANTIILIDYL